MSSLPDLSLVLPSWNGWEALRAHLPSVLRAAQTFGSAEVVVCDDGSDDGTPARVTRAFPRARVVRRPRNQGFAHAANDAVFAARAPRVLLLNDDMEVHPETPGLLVAALEADPGLFAVVPSIVRVRTGEEESGTRLRFRRGMVSTSIGSRNDVPPAYACGGAMAFRKTDFVALGGFDPLYAPFYWEDVDLSYRARKRGRTLARVLPARVDHDHGRTIVGRFPLPAISRIYERNRLLFTWKNVHQGRIWRRHLAALPVKALWDLAAHPAFATGLRDAWRLRDGVAARRKIEHIEGTVPDACLLEEGA